MKITMRELTFGQAFDALAHDGICSGIRLPHWKEDVVIRVQRPYTSMDMTHPYLYVESRFGRVPWKETVVEMFSTKWELVND